MIHKPHNSPADGNALNHTAHDAADSNASPPHHTVAVTRAAETVMLDVVAGTILRDALLEAGLSPYTSLTSTFNCGGRGLCATCGVWLDTSVEPVHWHDRLAARFDYPRLSCQIAVDRDLRVHLVDDKVIWGSRQPGRDTSG